MSPGLTTIEHFRWCFVDKNSLKQYLIKKGIFRIKQEKMEKFFPKKINNDKKQLSFYLTCI